MKTRKIIILSAVAFVVLIFAFLLVYKAWFYPHLNFGGDENFYISSNGKMLYSSGCAAIQNTDGESFDLCSDDGKRQYKCSGVAEFNDCVVYSDDEGVYLETSEGSERIFSSCPDMFLPHNEKIYIADKNGDLYIYNLPDGKLTSKAFDCGDAEWIGASGDSLYAQCVVYEEDSTDADGIRWKGGKQTVTFLCLNAETLERENTFSLTTSDDFESVKPLMSGNKLLFALTHSNTNETEVYLVDFVKSQSRLLFEHDSVTGITANDDCIYFCSERVKYTPFKVTDDNFKSTNGLWKYEISGGKKEKISGTCDYEDLLATNDYLYCYKTARVFPRLLFDNINFGYCVDEMPLAENS